MPIAELFAPPEERDLLRASLRGLLEREWPADHALQLAASPPDIQRLWRRLAQQGIAALGAGADAGGIDEIIIVLEELGRAACPVPIIGAILANMAFATGEAATILAALDRGEATVALALGAFDGDRDAGAVTVSADGTLSGRLCFAEGTAGATHLLTFTADPPMAALVDLTVPGITITPTPGLAVPALADVILFHTPTLRLSLPRQAIEDYARLARFCLVARSLGATERGFELVVEYVKTRHQFGQAIGKFQALQHKLSNCLINLDGSRLALAHAAQAHATGAADWRVSAAMATAFAGPALRRTALEIQHAFGAIGYAEEHEAPRHFRRVHADLARCGGVRHAHEELAAALLDRDAPPLPSPNAPPHALPVHDLGAAADAFRAEVQGWLKTNWTAEDARARRQLPFKEQPWDPSFSRRLGEMGWLGMAWPREYGGQERSAYEQLVLVEEMEFAAAPLLAHICSNDIIALSLIAAGTPEQKRDFLPAFLRGERSFCLGYSESEAGSDLASLRTRAVADGEDWVITGQKLWTTSADQADYIWLAARTGDETLSKHAGISIFVVPMNTPGITVRPGLAMYGHTFSTVFYDDVRVPASAMVGGVNGGWKVITQALAAERIVMGRLIARVQRVFDLLVERVRSTTLRDDPLARDRIAGLAAETEVARLLVTRVIAESAHGDIPVHHAAMSKVFSSELMERLPETALDILGSAALLSDESPTAPAGGEIEHLLRTSIMMVVGGGTNEIQRTLIAVRGLGLPR